MIDSMVVFYNLSFQKNNKIKNDYTKDEYSKVIKTALEKDLQNNTIKIYLESHRILLWYFDKDYRSKFSLTTDYLKNYLENMKI